MSEQTLTQPASSVGDAVTCTDITHPHATVTQAAEPLPASGFGYDLEAELGRGGMGVVYRARQRGLNRLAAVKMVLGGERADPKQLIRFLAEAEAVAAVRSPHVVQVYDYGQTDGRPYLAMEYCDGGSLADRLKAGRMAPAAAADLLAKVADGVAAAHCQGIVHRDLKPANVLFDAAGEPKVTDFGLAKRGAGADLTNTHALMGTPAYMSPEQARGQTKFVGPQADVWALGVMLYECLAGVRPFADDDTWALLNKVMTAEPAGLRAVAADVPRDLDLIVRKCLAKEPHERYATAAELAADLRAWRGGRPISARRAGPVERAAKWVRRNRLVAGSAAAVFLALAVGAGAATVQWRRAERALTLVTARETETAEALADGQLEAAEFLIEYNRHEDAERLLDIAASHAERVEVFRPGHSDNMARLARTYLARGRARSYKQTGPDGSSDIERAVAIWEHLARLPGAPPDHAAGLALALLERDGIGWQQAMLYTYDQDDAERYLRLIERPYQLLVSSAAGTSNDPRVFRTYARTVQIRAICLNVAKRYEESIRDCEKIICIKDNTMDIRHIQALRIKSMLQTQRAAEAVAELDRQPQVREYLDHDAGPDDFGVIYAAACLATPSRSIKYIELGITALRRWIHAKTLSRNPSCGVTG